MIALLAGCSRAVTATAPDGGALATLETADPDDSAAPDDAFALLSLNLHCLRLDGTPFATNAERFAAVATLVAERGVDAIAAQEVCVGAEDARALLVDALDDATGEAWSVAWAFAHVGWEGTPDQADEGVAVFARGPIAASREVPYAAPGTLRRVGLVASLDALELATVHLDLDDAAAREDQARQTAVSALLGAADRASVDAVVAGDLNDEAGSPTHGAFGLQGFEDATASLAGSIDHAFVHRGAAWGATAAERVLPDVSDHDGVLVTLVRRDPAPVAVTRLTATVDVGFGSFLSVRGDAAPLDWDRGWWGVPVEAARWELVTTELDGPFAFKALRDDAIWEVGPDHTGTAGDAITFAPTF